MSKDWTPAELQAASEAMKAAGHMGYEEFCEELERQGFTVQRIPLTPNQASYNRHLRSGAGKHLPRSFLVAEGKRGQKEKAPHGTRIFHVPMRGFAYVLQSVSC